jgi:SecD/SecF fusion protein
LARCRSTIRARLVAVVVLVSVAASACGGTNLAQHTSPLDSHGVTNLIFQARASSAARVDSSTLGAAIAIMRSRLDDLGVGGATVNQSGSNAIAVRLPDVKNAAEAARVVATGGQLSFYDWEANVIGPNGKPAGPTNDAVSGDASTQGGSPGTSANALSEYAAVERAAQQPEHHYPLGSAKYGTYYYVDPAKKTVLTPAGEEGSARAQAVGYLKEDIDQSGIKLPADAKIVFVEPGTVVRQALTPNDNPDPTYNFYYVLRDDSVIIGKDITNPIAEQDPTTGREVVSFGFKGPATQAFENVTATLAHRGSANSVGDNYNFQHFAVTLDQRLITIPYIDFTQYPNGITDASTGSEISGDFTIASARALAAILATGQLPLELHEIPSTHS